MADHDWIAAPLLGAVIGSEATSFVVAEWTDAGGGQETPEYIAPLHIHNSDDEVWYVLEGVLRFRLGDREVDVEAGSAIMARRRTPHTFWNPRPEPARYLIVMTPNIHALINELHALPDRNPIAVRDLFTRHDCELCLPEPTDAPQNTPSPV